MDFTTNKPIYQQIVDFCFRKILVGEWLEEQRIPSVRELGMLLQVNPNTAMRAFEYMQSEKVIYLKRGTGYFVDQQAKQIILEIQKNEFFTDTLPRTFESMKLLGVTIEEIVERFNKQK